MSLVLRNVGKAPGACDHEDTEPFGSERNAEFFRCRRCGSVIVAQGGQIWVIRRSHGSPENQDFSF